MGAIEGKRVCSGTFGEIWVDDELINECYKAQAKVEFNKEEIKRCCAFGVAFKVTGYKGTGSLTLNKTSTRFTKLISDCIAQNRDFRCTVISKLADPDSWGCERIKLEGVSFDDLTLFDWEAQSPGETEHPFTFESYEYLDEITPGE